MMPLTPREIEFIGLISWGYTVRTAAAELSITYATGRTHMGRILLKLGAKHQAHAVAILIRREEI